MLIENDPDPLHRLLTTGKACPVDRTITFGQEDRELSGGAHGNGNLAPEPGDEVRGRGIFQGEETGEDPKVGAPPPVIDKKPTL